MSDFIKDHFRKLNKTFGEDIKSDGYKLPLTFELRKKIVETMLSHIKTPVFSFLDAGCGNGMFYEIVVRPVLKELKRADGIDFADNAAQQAGKYMDEVYSGNVLEMSWRFNRKYDLVNSLEIFQYITPNERESFFREHLERTNSGGYFLLTVPNLSSIYRKIFKPKPDLFPYSCNAEDVFAASHDCGAVLVSYYGIDIFRNVFPVAGRLKNFIAFELSFLFQKRQ